MLMESFSFKGSTIGTNMKYFNVPNDFILVTKFVGSKPNLGHDLNMELCMLFIFN